MGTGMGPPWTPGPWHLGGEQGPGALASPELTKHARHSDVSGGVRPQGCGAGVAPTLWLPRKCWMIPRPPGGGCLDLSFPHRAPGRALRRRLWSTRGLAGLRGLAGRGAPRSLPSSRQAAPSLRPAN